MTRILNWASENKRLLIAVAVIGSLIALGYLLGLQQYFSREFAQKTLLQHWYISFPLFIVLCSIANLTNTPSTLFMMTAVFLLGKAVAIPLIYVTWVIACLFTFSVVSFFAKDSLPKIENRWVQKLMGQLETRPIFAIFCMRLLVQAVPTLNYVLAMSKVRFRDYTIATILGLPIPVIALVYIYEFLLEAGNLV